MLPCSGAGIREWPPTCCGLAHPKPIAFSSPASGGAPQRRQSHGVRAVPALGTLPQGEHAGSSTTVTVPVSALWGGRRLAEEISEKNHIASTENLRILGWLRTREIEIFWKFLLNQGNRFQTPLKQKYLLLPPCTKAKLQNHSMVWVRRDR